MHRVCRLTVNQFEPSLILGDGANYIYGIYMTERLIEITVVIAIIAFVMYRGVKFANKPLRQREYKYLFKYFPIGSSVAIILKCNSLSDIRKHWMFDSWKVEYNLQTNPSGNIVKMVKDGEHFDTGLVVGNLTNIK